MLHTSTCIDRNLQSFHNLPDVGCRAKFSALDVLTQNLHSGYTTDNDGEGLPLPKHIIFTEPLDHAMRYPIGAGLVNVGNTCFLNATLQCLIHTPPLTNYMMSGHHSSVCPVRNPEMCILCNLQALTMQSVYAETESLNPRWFIDNLLSVEDEFYTEIGRNFGNGRQEDAHEYLRLTLERMQRCALIGQDHLDTYSKETNLVNQIFGGYIRSQVCCCRCGRKSNKYDPMMDLCVEVETTIKEAFDQFVKADILESENAYSCERCQQKVRATKLLTIEEPPNVLTIQLKRFQFGSSGRGNKINRAVEYPAVLDVRPYMSEKQGPPVMYRLYGIILHEGVSANSGHYIANVLSGEQWYCINDSHKRKRTLQQCINDKSAYLLFYQRDVGNTPEFDPSEMKTHPVQLQQPTSASTKPAPHPVKHHHPTSASTNPTTEPVKESTNEKEETYCFCGGRASGRMIGCDGDKCDVGWFHNKCVGLLEEDIPDGEWFCPKCSANRYESTDSMPLLHPSMNLYAEPTPLFWDTMPLPHPSMKSYHSTEPTPLLRDTTPLSHPSRTYSQKQPILKRTIDQTYNSESSAQEVESKRAKRTFKKVKKQKTKVCKGKKAKEETYCFCERRANGQMIGCDGDDCEVGWFHNKCVGVMDDEIPDGAWYCPKCIV